MTSSTRDRSRIGAGLGLVLRIIGIGALVAGGLALALWLVALVVFIGPIIFWLAWNVLEFGPAVGLPELGFWAILLATTFLAIGWFGKVIITGVVFVVDPGWFQQETLVHWPEPTLRNFIAIGLLSILAAIPHAYHPHHHHDHHDHHHHDGGRRRDR